MTTRELVVISTSPGREVWVQEILSSINRPCVVVSDFGYELGKIRWVLENTTAERFVFLQDSVVVRDESFIDLLFEAKGSSCLMCTPKCLGAYLGLYERKVLEITGVPFCNSKEDSIRFETEWTAKYIENCSEFNHPLPILQKKFHTLRKFGRENLVYVNDYYEKWYGNWGESVEGYDEISEGSSLELTKLQLIEKSRRVMDLLKENEKIKRSKLNKFLDAIKYLIKYVQGY